MLDLNQVPRQSARRYDKDAIARALRATAHKWVIDLFPQGKRGREKGKAIWRVADISGRAPRNKGSCVIQLEGEDAGGWVDFEDDKRLKGGPISTIKEHFKT